jgi:hypothetical protein
LTQQELSILSVDADEGNGELTIQIPYECQKILKGFYPLSPFNISTFLIKRTKNSESCNRVYY